MGQSSNTIKQTADRTEQTLHGPNVLYAASEMTPLIKTGGLAEVAGSLPAALNELGCDVRVVLPFYGDVAAGATSPRTLLKARIRGYDVEILETTALHDQRVWLVSCPELFGRSGNAYVGPDGRDWPDNAERFALFAETIAWLAVESIEPGYHADIVHLNDWQTALAAALLKRRPDTPATVFSIHNLAYQGIFDHATFTRLRLPADLWSMQGLEFHGSMSFIKAGIAFADRITTVSPTYAREIQTAQYGHGLDGLISHRAPVLRGILNGIDTTVWNPATDQFLRARYTANELARKLINKRAIQATLGLTASDVPLLGVVSRLAHQKGIDLILELIDSLIALPAQLAVLGTGDAALEQALHDAARRYPGRVAFAPRLDEALAHQIEAGADIFLMPSRFEPCGLNQMYSQLYGTVPIVRRTGGLADTVAPVTGRSGTGFLFDDATPEALLAVIKRAVTTFRHRHTWQAIQRNGMSQVFSWRRSAAQYLRLYEELLPRPVSPG
jgi:starch synthase